MLADPGLYVHFPWCVRKCPYCDFNSHPLRDQDSFQRYTDALIEDWSAQRARWAPPGNFASFFLGGGTPSLFAPEDFARLFEHLPRSATTEITMEANPGTTEHASFRDYLGAGINRLSIGAQSFDDVQLKRLGRIHAADEIRQAFWSAREAGFDNINVDLMWGLPQQSVAAAMADLDAAISLQPEHISWYQLTLEPKTEFAKRPPLLPVDDTLADIERHGLQRLADAGYARYEVSAFAVNGAQCRHNINYWSFGDYLGVGAGAHGKVTRHGAIHRTRKASQPRIYQSAPCETEVSEVPNQERIVEFMMNALRLVDGVSIELFQTRTGMPWSAVAPTWQTLQDRGLVEPARCATTPLGLRYLDSVVAEFLST